MSDGEKTAFELARDKAELEAAKVNAERSGVGTRVQVGATRGKNPTVITWEAFDTNSPESCPKTLQEFMDLTKTTDEKVMLGYVVDGYNDAQYTAASDPIAEYVNPVWPEEIKLNFRNAVRQYSRGALVSIEDAATLIRPAFDKAHAK